MATTIVVLVATYPNIAGHMELAPTIVKIVKIKIKVIKMNHHSPTSWEGALIIAIDEVEWKKTQYGLL